MLARHQRLQQFLASNKSHIDMTREPLTPIRNQPANPGFRVAAPAYLMTPPQSEEESSSERGTPYPDQVERQESEISIPIEGIKRAYRRRTGRGGRFWIDRRTHPPTTRAGNDDWIADRFKYDEDDDGDGDVYSVDPYSTESLRFRATLPFQQRRPQPDLPAAQGNQTQNAMASNSGQKQIVSSSQSRTPT